MKSYRPEDLFDETGRMMPQLTALAPVGDRRMSANPHANGGLMLRDLRLPDFRHYAMAIDQSGGVHAEAPRVQGLLIRDVIKLNSQWRRLHDPKPAAEPSPRGSAPPRRNPVS